MTPAAPRKLRVGVLVNPIAGLGGPSGGRGSDDPATVESLLSGRPWNEEVHAYGRGVSFVKKLDRTRVVVVTAPGVLGEDVIKRGTMFGGPVFEIVRLPDWSKRFGQTRAADTVAFAHRLLAAQIDLLVVVGGDGTAVDVARAMGPDLPLLGVPAGVKMFSAVFAQTPEMAAFVVNGLDVGFATTPVDVLDLDERSYKEGAWIVRSHAQARVPASEGIQTGKGMSPYTEAEAAEDLVAWFRAAREPGTVYVLGSGSTIGALKADLAGGSALGVDVWRDGAWLAVDAGEDEILAALGENGPAEILVSPTGVQGAVLGRGTAQITVPVIERVGVDRVRILATAQKLVGLRSLFVDTGDEELDRSFPDYVKVRTDPLTEKVFPLRKGIQLVG